MMSDRLGTEPSLDLGRLHQAIQEEYTAVARDPDRGYHFHTGRPLASLLGYHDDWLEGLPEGSIASFAGTGNPFRIGQLQPGERVVDIGSGAGIDSLIAAKMVAPDGQVIGVDMTPAMLETARKSVSLAGDGPGAQTHRSPPDRGYPGAAGGASGRETADRSVDGLNSWCSAGSRTEGHGRGCRIR